MRLIIVNCKRCKRGYYTLYEAPNPLCYICSPKKHYIYVVLR